MSETLSQLFFSLSSPSAFYACVALPPPGSTPRRRRSADLAEYFSRLRVNGGFAPVPLPPPSFPPAPAFPLMSRQLCSAAIEETERALRRTCRPHVARYFSCQQACRSPAHPNTAQASLLAAAYGVPRGMHPLNLEVLMLMQCFPTFFQSRLLFIMFK